MVSIYHRYECIAQHTRQLSAYDYTTKIDHLPAKHQFVKRWSADFFLKQGKKVGQACQGYIQAILNRAAHPEQAYKSCQGVLSLKAKYGAERLDKACQRALHFEAYSYHTVKNILERGWEQLEDLSQPTQTPVIPLHVNIRGKEYYQ